MSKWNMDGIRQSTANRVREATAGWDAEAVREKLIDVLAASYPIRATLSGLADNPDRPHGGMAVTSGMWPEQFDSENVALDEPWGSVFDGKNYVPAQLSWPEPVPERLQHKEAAFAAGETLHEETPILSVWQYATAASIFVGSFDLSDVKALERAVAFPPAPTGE